MNPFADEPSPIADMHGIRASADTGPDLPDEAWVPADTDPGPPEARKLSCTILSGRSENIEVSVV